MKLIIPGPPIAKARARHVRRGKAIITYNPQKDCAEFVKSIIKQQFNQNIAENALYFDQSYAFFVHLDFFFPFSKSISPWNIDHHIFKPDIDNCIKFFCDVLNGIIFNDDRQIIDLKARKLFSSKPRTEITIMPVQKMSLDEKVKKILDIFDPTSFGEFYEDVETLDMLFKAIDLKNMEDNNPEWLTSAACFLSDFSHKYLNKLSKIKKIGEIE